MNKIFIVTLCLAVVFSAAGEIKNAGIGKDTRVGGDLLRWKNYVYAIGGTNVSGYRQIRKITLDEKGMPCAIENVAEIAPGRFSRVTTSAIYKNWIYVLGLNIGDKAIRFTIMEDGKLTDRTEIPLKIPEKGAMSENGLLVSGKYLVAIGGWQYRQVFTSEIKEDGSLGEWVKRKPVPTILFCNKRCFRMGKRIFASGNHLYHNETDRVYSTEVDEEGLPTKWQRWAELPESQPFFDFMPTHDGKHIFYRSGETGKMYYASLVENDEIGEWVEYKSLFPVEKYITLGILPLNENWLLRFNNLSGDPREFHPSDLIPLRK